MSVQSSNGIDLQAREAAMAALASQSVQPTSLVKYESRGVVAIIGGEAARQAASLMQGRLVPQLILYDKKSSGDIPATRVRDRRICIEGYLGNFTITLSGEGADDAMRDYDTESLQADLVLDLTEIPLLGMPLKPPGYLAAGTSETALQAAIDELSVLTGTFEKPKYFDYNPDICAHGRSGITACTRCIDACPADAIKSLTEVIEVESHLCQGGGACATACPSGAIRYLYPTADDTLALLRRMLKVYIDEGGQQPAVVFHARETEFPEAAAANQLPVAVEELASIGIETWLSALAYGATRVLLLDDGNTPARVGRVIDQQLVTADEILTAMQYPSGVVRRIDSASLTLAEQPMMPSIKAATFAGASAKRQTVFMAIDALYKEALSLQTAKSREPSPVVTLTAGAPFGAVAINDKSCTLCLSCVSACPGNALQSGQDVPQLRFIESNCLQCGLCTLTCPEDAIHITPRLLFDREARNHPITLYEEEPFCCVSCGKPFATQSVINSMMTKLAGHWMFADESAMQRLKMCEDCRVVDVVQDAEMMGKGIDSGRITH